VVSPELDKATAAAQRSRHTIKRYQAPTGPCESLASTHFLWRPPLLFRTIPLVIRF